MFRHESALRAALDSIDRAERSAREALYEQARLALFTSLKARQPMPSNVEIEAEALALEQAILTVERELSGHVDGDPAPATDATPGVDEPDADRPGRVEAEAETTVVTRLRVRCPDTRYGEIEYRIPGRVSKTEFKRLRDDVARVPHGRELDDLVLDLLGEQADSGELIDAPAWDCHLHGVRRALYLRYLPRGGLEREVVTAIIDAHLENIREIAIAWGLGDSAEALWALLQTQLRPPPPAGGQVAAPRTPDTPASASARDPSRRANGPTPAAERNASRRATASEAAKNRSEDAGSRLGGLLVWVLLGIGVWYAYDDDFRFPFFSEYDRASVAEGRARWLNASELSPSQIEIDGESEKYAVSSGKATYCVGVTNRGPRVLEGLSARVFWGEPRQTGVLPLALAAPIDPQGSGMACAELTPAARSAGGDVARIYAAMMKRTAMGHEGRPVNWSSRPFARDREFNAWVTTW